MFRRSSLALVGVAAFATTDGHAQGTESWECFAYGDSDRASVVLELSGTLEAGESTGRGAITLGAFSQGARFHIQGVYRRWDFDDGIYSFTIGPDGTGRHFVSSSPGEIRIIPVNDSDEYVCELSR